MDFSRLSPILAATAFCCVAGSNAQSNQDLAPNHVREQDLVQMFEKKGLLPLASDGYLTIYLDNDLFAGSDEGYTNGVRLSYISGSRTPEEFGSVQKALRRLIGDNESYGFFRDISGFDDPNKISYNFGLSLTQLMFTPETLDAPTAPPGERPYAGWLGLGYSLHAKDTDSLTSLGFIVGVIGPSALGEQTQNLVHDIRGFDRFEGWDSQIDNEITFDLLYDRKENVQIYESGSRRFKIDGFTEWGVSLGSFRTNAYAGGMLRYGYNLSKAFPDPRLSLNSYSLEPFQGQIKPRVGWSIYGLLGVRGTYAAYDASLDGPVFDRMDTGVTREPLVGEAYAGFGIRRGTVDLSYVHTFRTREFEEDDNSSQSFGSLALRYRF